MSHRRLENSVYSITYEIFNAFQQIIKCDERTFSLNMCVSATALHANVENYLQVWQELSSCWDGRLFGHNRHGPKSRGAAVPPSAGDLGPHLTQCRLGRGLPPYQVASGTIKAFGHNTPPLQTDRTDRTTVRSIRRTVTCNGRPKTVNDIGP